MPWPRILWNGKELTVNDSCFLSNSSQSMTFTASDVASQIAWVPPGTPDHPMIWDIQSNTVLDPGRTYPMMVAKSFSTPLPVLDTDTVFGWGGGARLCPLSNRWSEYIKLLKTRSPSSLESIGPRHRSASYQLLTRVVIVQPSLRTTYLTKGTPTGYLFSPRCCNGDNLPQECNVLLV